MAHPPRGRSHTSKGKSWRASAPACGAIGRSCQAHPVESCTSEQFWRAKQVDELIARQLEVECAGPRDVLRLSCMRTAPRVVAASPKWQSERICGEGLLAFRNRYCPLCFQACPPGTMPHGRLIWCIAEVQCCPMHKVRLRDAQCGRSGGAASVRSPVLPDGICRDCGAIGHACFTDASVPCSEAELWVAEQVAAVIANQAGIEGAGVAATKQFLKRYSEEPGKSLQRIATSAGVPISGLSRFVLRPGARLRLHTFLRIAAAERFALVDLLLGRASPGTLQCFRLLLEGNPFERAWGSEPERLMLEAVQRLTTKYCLRGTVASRMTNAVAWIQHPD